MRAQTLGKSHSAPSAADHDGPCTLELELVRRFIEIYEAIIIYNWLWNLYVDKPPNGKWPHGTHLKICRSYYNYGI